MNHRHPHFFQFLALLSVILALMSLPVASVERVRGGAAATLAPLWRNLCSSQTLAVSFFSAKTAEEEQKEQHSLEIENQMLKNSIKKMQLLFEHELRIIAELTNLSPDLDDPLALVQQQILSIPAQVIYRSPSSWSSSLWVDIGEKENEKRGKTIVAINSPVVVGKHVVGIVDYVGNTQSKVRLITDSGFTPSVRVSRGNFQERQLKEHIQILQGLLATRPDLFDSSQEKTELLKTLDTLKKKVDSSGENWLLAKGELQGASYPLWRSHGQTLKGIGFNYDYSDAEGPARDLRSGAATPASESIPTMPIIQEGDTLVTTGYDGMFPFGLSVAKVTKIHMLKEGDYYYELEALPTAGDLSELEMVYILPPVSGQSSAQKIRPVATGF